MKRRHRKILIALIYPFYVIAMYFVIGAALACFILHDFFTKNDFHARFISMCLEAFELEIDSWKKQGK